MLEYSDTFTRVQEVTTVSYNLSLRREKEQFILIDLQNLVS